jgi:hypothetical protein
MNGLEEMRPITNQIAELQTQFYAQNTKSTFFKNTQKLECAAAITQSIQIDELFKKTVYHVQNTNHVYFDYTIFKTYGHPGIYDQLVDYILAIFTACIQAYDRFEIHINLQSFTMTAAQRYKDITRIFCSKCLGRNTVFYSHVDSLHIYNPPKMIDAFSNLFSGFIDETIRSKVSLHTT